MIQQDGLLTALGRSKIESKKSMLMICQRLMKVVVVGRWSVYNTGRHGKIVGCQFQCFFRICCRICPCLLQRLSWNDGRFVEAGSP